VVLRSPQTSWIEDGDDLSMPRRTYCERSRR